jgi:hypothetical protein
MKRVAIVVVGLALAALACQAVVDPSLTNLEVGDCVASAQVGVIKKVERRACGSGLLRVTKKFELRQFSTWPGSGAVDFAVSLSCPSGTVNVMTPTEESWKEAGDREVVCFEYVR